MQKTFGLDGQMLLPAVDLDGRPMGKPTRQKLLRLVESQSFKCGLTGAAVTPKTASVDHSIPLTRGGEDSMENLEVLHRLVNSSKQRLTREEFLGMCVAALRTAQRDPDFDADRCERAFRSLAEGC